MDKIIRLDVRHGEQLFEIDIESEHQGDIEQKFSKTEMRKRISERFGKKQEIFFGYKKNNELMGYITLVPYFPGDNHCEVYWLAVKKKAHGEGIGSKLLQYIEAYAKHRGFRRVCLYTARNMDQTRAFYEKNAYRFVNEFPGYYDYSSGETTAVLLVKDI